MEKTLYITSKKLMKHKVYVLLNEYGVVEYVGETTNIKQRLQTHKQKPSQRQGKFHGRNDIMLEVIKEFDNHSDALNYEGELKKELGFEWTEKTRASKGGKIGGNMNFKSGKMLQTQKKSAEVRRIPISAYLKDTGEYVGTYASQRDCANQLMISDASISSFLKGKFSQVGGYTFKREVK